MMNLKNKIGSSFIKLFCLLMGTLFWVFSLLVLSAIVDNFDSAGLLVLFAIFSSIAVVAVSLGINLFRTISVDSNSKKITIKYLGLFETHWTGDIIKGQNAFTLWTKIGIVHKTIIETIDGRQIAFTNFEIEEYEATKEIISTTFQLNEEIKDSNWLMLRNTVLLMMTTMALVIAFGLIFR